MSVHTSICVVCDVTTRQVRGYGLSGDGHHITQPHPQGLGARLCMERAITGEPPSHTLAVL